MKAREKARLSVSSIAAVVLFVVVGSALTRKPPGHHVVATVVDVYVAGARFARTQSTASVAVASTERMSEPSAKKYGNWVE